MLQHSLPACGARHALACAVVAGFHIASYTIMRVAATKLTPTAPAEVNRNALWEEDSELNASTEACRALEATEPSMRSQSVAFAQPRERRSAPSISSTEK